MPWLEWLDRKKDMSLSSAAPYRLLEPIQRLDHGIPDANNMLIQGDNLDALKALLPYYGGEVKCVFIDPPYNTMSAFEQYDDNLEHSQWLAMMYPRMELLRQLLREDGSIWITLDDNEAHYFKVMCDEIFGRANFMVDIAWHRKISPANDAKWFSNDNDHLFVYAKRRDALRINKLDRTERNNAVFKNPDNDPRGPWNSVTLTGNKTKAERPNLHYAIIHPLTGQEIWPPPGLTWRVSREKCAEMMADNAIYWGKQGTSTSPRIKRFASEAKPVIPRSLWHYDEAGHTQEAMLESKALFGETPFGTPKPERLLKRILEIATRPGDVVLDSFLGSGTTAAVAQKMDRRWIGIEVGEHAQSHCLPRLQKVVDGEQGGISEDVNWKGGGGFRFYRLGPAVFDDDGRIREGIKFEWLAAHVWFAETGTARSTRANKSPLLGVHEGTAYYLLYNGVLGDKRVNGGNVLTLKLLSELPPFDGRKVIYGEATRLSAVRLQQLGITFRQTPYDIRAR